jgi:hypothetical protein
MLPILSEHERRRSKGESEDREDESVTMPHQGVLLETFFPMKHAMQIAPLHPRMSQRRRREIIEPTLKASA